MKNMDEKVLVTRAKARDIDAIEELIRRNKGMLLVLAKNLSLTCESLDIDDLYQEGAIEIVNAIERYDLSSDTKFSTYIYKCIKGRMLNVMQKYDRLIRYPKTIIEKIIETEKKINELNRQLGKTASFEEILLNTNITYEELIEYNKLNRKVLRLEDMKLSYYSSEIEESSIDVELELISDEDVEKTAINNTLVDMIFSSYYLSDIEKKVLYLLYYEKMSMSETGKAIGYSPEGVKIVKVRSLKKIRNNLIKNW